MVRVRIVELVTSWKLDSAGMAHLFSSRSCIAGEASDNGLVTRTRVIGVVAIQ